MWLCILLLVTLNAAMTDGQYTRGDIQDIFLDWVMGFHDFPPPAENGRKRHQYGVLLLLPPFKRTQQNQQLPPIGIQGPARKIQSCYEYMLVGVNYAVASPCGERHTETQLLKHLPDLLHNYKQQHMTNPTILLYTRGTPCLECTRAIARLRYFKYSGGQFIVAYSTNMINRYMSPIINCQNRQFLRNFALIDVYCVKEPNKNQCQEDDTIPCIQHFRYGG